MPLGMPKSLLVLRPIVQPIQRAVAAVEKDAHRLEVLAGGGGDGNHRQGPGAFGLLVHSTPEAPVFVLGGGDLRRGGHVHLLAVVHFDACRFALWASEAKCHLNQSASFSRITRMPARVSVITALAKATSAIQGADRASSSNSSSADATCARIAAHAASRRAGVAERISGHKRTSVRPAVHLLRKFQDLARVILHSMGKHEVLGRG